MNDQRTSTAYGLLPHPEQPAILMFETPNGWILPQTTFSWHLYFSAVGPVSQAMGQLLGHPARVLRYISHDIDEGANTVEAVVELESLEPVQEPPLDGAWISLAQLADSVLADDRQRAVLETYLTELDHKITPPQRCPWACPGWHDGAFAWIDAQLCQRGYQRTAPIEQFDSWGLTCLLRIETDHGVFFFKASPATLPLFANEPAIMAALSERFPDYVPAPIAIDAERHWLLLADFGDDGQAADDEVREAVFQRFGQLQLALVDQVDALLKIGCVDRRLAHLQRHIDPLLADTEMLSTLQPSEIEQLRRLAPRLKTLCDQLASYNIPHTLIHGDLNTSNFTGPIEQIRFFDWTEGAVAHPFIDMFGIFFEKDKAKQTKLRDSYLPIWADYEPRTRLLEAWHLAEPLCGLHHAISYQQFVPQLETPFREALDWAMPKWLGKVLACFQGEFL